MIVYLARDIPAFVMYCVNGESGSSLLIESTDSMILRRGVHANVYMYIYKYISVTTFTYSACTVHICDIKLSYVLSMQ